MFFYQSLGNYLITAELLNKEYCSCDCYYHQTNDSSFHPLFALLIGGSLSMCLGDNSNVSPIFVCVRSGVNVCLTGSAVKLGTSDTGVLSRSLSAIGGTVPLLVAAPVTR